MTIQINPEALAALPESERKLIERDLESVTRLIDQNPLLNYYPHEKQRKFHEARTAIKAFFGGNRSGKSTAGVVDDIIQAIDRDAVPEHLQSYKKWEPPFYCRIVSPDFTSTMEGVIFQKIREWMPKDQLKGGSWDRAYDKQRRMLRLKNGSWFVFNTLEQDVDKHSGLALHRVHWDEEPGGTSGEEIRKENLMRLVDYNGDEVFTMTPLFGMSWVHDDIWEKRTDPDITAIQVDIDENPHISEEAKKRILSGTYTKEELEARKSGAFVHFSGLFYPEFSDSSHVGATPSPERIKQQTVVVGIDPGYRRTGVVFCAFDNDNACIVFDEMYPEQKTVEEVAAEIKLREKVWGIKPSTYVIDPAARSRNAINAEQIETEYLRAGIPCQHGQNARAPGILEVKRRLQHGQLVIADRCPNLIWEFGRYRRDPKSSDEFDAVKVDDHLLDALRYALMSRVWGAPPIHQARQYRAAYNPHFQEPYRNEKFQPTNSPPLGDMS
jgi:phage terminase large subunit